jgi:hypothetical protein
MCINKRFIKVHIGNHLFDSFPIQICLKKDVLLPLFFKVAEEFAIMEVHENRDIVIKWDSSVSGFWWF